VQDKLDVLVYRARDMCQVELAVILVTLSRKQSVFKVDFKFLEQCHVKGQLDRADFDLRETMILYV
jgi:hypothetical protein